MLSIDLRGKRAFVAGVADDGGFGFAIAKALVEAGATVIIGTWPPALGIFRTILARGKLDASLTLSTGEKMTFEEILPLDADFDVETDVPTELRESKRYRELSHVSIQGAADDHASILAGQDAAVVGPADDGAPCKPLRRRARRRARQIGSDGPLVLAVKEGGGVGRRGRLEPVGDPFQRRRRAPAMPGTRRRGFAVARARRRRKGRHVAEQRDHLPAAFGL